MKKLLLLFLLTGPGLYLPLVAQERYFTKTGHISFFSKAPLEDIVAHNREVVSLVDFKTGEMVFTVPMRAFQFRKSLMQQHFNENYIESDKYPKAYFRGKVNNIAAVNLAADNTYKVLVEGTLTIHGVAKPIRTEGTFQVKGGQVTGRSTFTVAPADYDITIPLLVREHIAKTIDITVDMLYKPFQGNL
ncbi:YceI family protein [Pontibacter beigongshangensis]|uniref:YceI family protein n=1 Tax=Pontibacter beigongshangensis TaxID=2574733 RepID=UPI00164F91D9|nr:YceI family protein [Pontibacter beigongshangensis]